MNLVTRSRQALARWIAPRQKALSPVDNRGGWWPIIRESEAGAFQRNVTVTLEDGLQYWAVFRAVSLISGDIAKMRLKLVEQETLDGIWSEVEVAAFSEILTRPNHYQNQKQFIRNWVESKLTRGNTYVLKRRDPANGRVTGLYILDPNRTTPMVNTVTGEVFYQLMRDDLVGLTGTMILVPASEIIHDRWNTLYHPLVGLSPLYAHGINALTGLRIEQNTARLFTNGARPSGILTAPGAINDSTAARLKAYWDENFTGENAGKVAVLGDGLKYEAMVMTAVEAQLIEQLKWNDGVIFGCYGIPAHMGNIGNAPTYNNVEALTQQYFSQALQCHVEDIELLLDEGLELADLARRRRLGTEFELEGLLRMDTATQVKTYGEGVIKGIFKPDEARAKIGLGPVTGGNEVYLQQQNYSLAALAKRDAKPDPFATAAPAAEAPAEPDEDDDAEAAAEAEAAEQAIEQGLAA